MAGDHADALVLTREQSRLIIQIGPELQQRVDELGRPRRGDPQIATDVGPAVRVGAVLGDGDYGDPVSVQNPCGLDPLETVETDHDSRRKDP
jgi:hypothetical protein